MDWQQLPAINASFNGVAGLCLLGGFIAIKNRKIEIHRSFMVAALICSALFLCGYLTHKTIKGMSGQAVNTTFAGEGVWRAIYYPMLITHLILAMAFLPLVFFTVKNAIQKRFTRHKAWARWTWPIWMYVSVTGVLVYFFLYQWFPVA